MGVLNTWQRIDRVLPGQPFGNGRDGAYSSATIPTLTKDSCSGSASSKTLTTSGSTFANGDVILIHQSRGTGAGNWEINKVSSGGGSTSLTLQEALHYTYTDSGASQAQAIKIPQYTTIVVQSGTWSLTGWAGNTDGILPLAACMGMTITGNISGNGKGFRGGSPPYQGEGTDGGGTTSTAANGNGGGGGNYAGSGDGAGAGGGHATNGSNGGSQGGGIGGTGGNSSGSADLTTLTFGGAGGGGKSDDSTSGSGGNSGAIALFFVKSLTAAGTTSMNGYDGGAPGGSQAGGGGGAAGSILVVCQIATLGTNKFTVAAGAGGNVVGADGGNGSVGRIAVHHSGIITGSTSPSFTDVEDKTLVESGGAALFALI